MNKIKLPLVFILLLTIIFGSKETSRAFNDLENHWSSPFVSVLSEKNLINGYEDGTFKPDNNTTKAEFYKIINGLAGYTRTYAVSFADVQRTDWFYSEVSKAVKAGYLTPTTGNLHPNKPITRQEAMRIIAYVYKLNPDIQAADTFNDSTNINNDSKGYVGALVTAGVVEGYPDGTINPNAEITRGEISKILSICIEKFGSPKESYLMDSSIKFGPRNFHD